MNRLLEIFGDWKPRNAREVDMGHPNLTDQAMRYLQDKGFMEYRQDNVMTSGRLTAQGYEYWAKINTFGPWYWFKQNWFPSIVAAATIAASVGGIVVNVLTPACAPILFWAPL